jgi:two-component system sensor histidine kinase SenX3
MIRRRDRRSLDEAGAALSEAGRGMDDLVLERDRLSLALERVRDGVIVVDPDGEVVFRNAAAERFADARRSDAVAEDLINRLLQRALQGENAELELPLFGPPREVLLIQAIPLLQANDLVGAAAFVNDITELRRVESVRRDFVANVSHELKTPIGALGLLAETIPQSDDPTVVRGLAEQILREAERLARIVDDLLDLSFVEAQEVPTREQVAVRVIIEEALERVRPLALARGIPVHEAPISGDLVVACDPGQVVSAVTNLLDNAIKYSDEHHQVDVSARRENGSAVIEVRDRGIGIPTKDLERVFERFYRVDPARSRSTGGTGLGLSIVRHIAQVHSGEVTVTSREGEGSTFKFVLPIIDAADGAGAGDGPTTNGMAAAS